MRETELEIWVVPRVANHANSSSLSLSVELCARLEILFAS